jgi:predicted ATPase
LQQLHLDLLRGNGEPVQAGPEPVAPARDNLPVALTGFVGRDEELTRLDELLAGSRLVTMIGPGGVGKTRLAVEAANRNADRYRDGRWLVPLASVTDPNGIVPAFLEALQLRSAPSIERPEGTVRDVTERLVGALSAAEALVIVDNCEHLIVEVAELIALIGQRCPRVRVVATSREPLGLMGEALFSVPPLTVPSVASTLAQATIAPAVQLLQARAAAVRNGFAVTQENLPAVLEIVRRLDGLPLAIELAAARLRLLPPAQVAALLSDRFRLLSGGNRAALPRHRTLWAVVDWSWDLLDDIERAVAERLSVFTGSWTVGAAAAVCSDLGLDEDAVREILLSLTDKSLVDAVVQDTASVASFRMLETIKEFALVRCTEGGGLDAARRAHAAHYEELTRRLTPKLRGADQPRALAALQAAHNDIVDAIRFLTDSGEVLRARKMAGRLTWFWIITDLGFDLTDQLAQLSQAEPADDPVALTLAGFRLMADMAAGVAVGDIEQRREQARDLALRMTAAGPLTGSAGMFEVLLYYFSGDLQTAMTLTDRLVRRSAGRWLRGTAHLMFAMFAENTGDLDEVRRRLTLAWSQLEGHPDRWAKAALINLRGRIRLLDGDQDGAIADAETSLRVSIGLGARDDELQTRLQLSQLYAGRQRFAEAHEQIDALEKLLKRSAVALPAALGTWAVAVPVGRLGILDLQGDAVAAGPLREHLDETLETAARRDGQLVAVAWAVLAMSWARIGEQEKALRALRFSYPIALATEDRPVIATYSEAAAVVAAATDRADDAAEFLGAAAKLRGGQNRDDPFLVPAIQFATKELGEAGFEAAYDRGRQLTADQALARINPAGA